VLIERGPTVSGVDVVIARDSAVIAQQIATTVFAASRPCLSAVL
jgi:hypothetical protein